MATVKKSFISNLIGKGLYEELKDYSKPIIYIGSGFLLVLFLLSLCVHWRFVSKLLSLVTGTSLLFLVYIAALILFLDKEVDVGESVSYYRYNLEKMSKTRTYKLTIVWGVVLILFGISAIFFSNRYREQYAFDCSTILVDQSSGIYHLEWIDDCEVAAEADWLKEMKGYEIKGKGYRICDWCEEYAKEVEEAYYSDIF